MGPHGGLSLRGGTAAVPRIGTWNLELGPTLQAILLQTVEKWTSG